MTLPPNIRYKSANWYSDRKGQPIQAIIAHDTETPKTNPQVTSEAYLQRGGSRPDGSDRKVSIHVWINTNGDSTVMVNDTLAANHAGFGTLKINGKTYSPQSKYSVNTCTLGFELEHVVGEATYPEKQLLSAGYWIYVWRNRWGKLPLYKHADVDPKRRSDPVHLTVETLERYATMAETLLEEPPTPEKPINFRTVVPQVVYTDRSLASPFATEGITGKPFVISDDVVIPIGDITGDWAWISTGIGFIPKRTLKKA